MNILYEMEDLRLLMCEEENVDKMVEIMKAMFTGLYTDEMFDTFEEWANYAPFDEFELIYRNALEAIFEFEPLNSDYWKR